MGPPNEKRRPKASSPNSHSAAGQSDLENRIDPTSNIVRPGRPPIVPPIPTRGDARLAWLDSLDYVVMLDTVAMIDWLRGEYPDACPCCLGSLISGVADYLSERITDAVELGLAAHGIFLSAGDAA